VKPNLQPRDSAVAAGVSPGYSEPIGRPTPPRRIERAAERDIAAIAALLREAGLPHDEIAPHVARFLVARDEHDSVIGAIGAEKYAPDALLRSLVVAPPQRGAGLGDALLRQLEKSAAGWGVTRWWLLTTTAETFFAGRGFVVISRDQAPGAIRQTGQFQGGCCRSAVCLSRPRRD